MAVFTIVGLTLKEAVRRRTLVGSLVLGALVLGLSLLLITIRTRMHHTSEVRHWSPEKFAIPYASARSAITLLCIASIKSLSALFAVMLAAGSVSSEIERGLLAVILPKPIPRWQILLGKWIGLNIILTASVLLWVTLVWASLTRQTHMDLTPLLYAARYLSLYPVVISTISLSLSTFAQRLFGTSLAMTMIAFAWFDGVFNALGSLYDTEFLHTLANIAGMVVPQGYIGWWVEEATADIITVNHFGNSLGTSPQFLKEWGEAHLHFAHLDGLYIAFYVVVVFLLGTVIFQKRDV